jgi:GntR family transcriptional regulator
MEPYENRPRDRIAEQIECYIIEHGLKEGDSLPSERQLCESWNCNRMTFRSAAKRLINAGILAKNPLVNYYIPPSKLNRNLQDLTSLTEFVRGLGLHLTNRLLDQTIIKATPKLAAQFFTDAGSPILRIIRLRLIEGEPISIDTSYVLCAKFPKIDQYDFEELSLYGVLEDEYGVVIDHGNEEINLTFANDEESELLGIEEGASLFYLKGTTFDINDEVIEVFKSVARSDKIRFVSELRKQ